MRKVAHIDLIQNFIQNLSRKVTSICDEVTGIVIVFSKEIIRVILFSIHQTLEIEWQ
jgi:hypothetical protein